MTIWLVCQWFALLCVFIATCSIMWWTWRLGISPMPSNRTARTAMRQWLLTHPPQPGCIIEPGAGWGQLAFQLAKDWPEHQIIAYERSLFPWLWLRLRLQLHAPQNLSIRREDFHKAQWQNASAIVCYLFTGAMRKLSQTLPEQLSEGCWIVSNTFSLPGWKSHETMVLNDLYRTRIHVYKIPDSLPTHNDKGAKDARAVDPGTDR